MPGMLLLIVVLVATFGGAIGFVLGYVAGQRSAARLNQRGFPLDHVIKPPPDSD
jgi:hypothetical protein